MLFIDGRVKRPCKYCGESFRPRVADQIYCRRWCRLHDKASQGRAARRVWRQAGRPTLEQLEKEAS
jgi:hypothetical protein